MLFSKNIIFTKKTDIWALIFHLIFIAKNDVILRSLRHSAGKSNLKQNYKSRFGCKVCLYTFFLNVVYVSLTISLTIGEV